jgi:hypothetical protein
MPSGPSSAQVYTQHTHTAVYLGHVSNSARTYWYTFSSTSTHCSISVLSANTIFFSIPIRYWTHFLVVFSGQMYSDRYALWCRHVCSNCGLPPKGEEWFPIKTDTKHALVNIQLLDRSRTHLPFFLSLSASPSLSPSPSLNLPSPSPTHALSHLSLSLSLLSLVSLTLFSRARDGDSLDPQGSHKHQHLFCIENRSALNAGTTC